MRSDGFARRRLHPLRRGTTAAATATLHLLATATAATTVAAAVTAFVTATTTAAARTAAAEHLHLVATISVE